MSLATTVEEILESLTLEEKARRIRQIPICRIKTDLHLDFTPGWFKLHWYSRDPRQGRSLHKSEGGYCSMNQRFESPR